MICVVVFIWLSDIMLRVKFCDVFDFIVVFMVGGQCVVFQGIVQFDK